MIGAPWVDGRALAAALRTERLGGVAFVPVEFTPEASKFQGELCRGVQISITNRAAFEPLRTGLAIAIQLRTLHPDDWQTKNYNRLLGNTATYQAVLETKSLEDVLDLTRGGLNEFMRRRARHLMY